MYFLLLAAIVDRHQEQPFVLAEDEPLCTMLVAHPDQSHPVENLMFHAASLVLQRDYVQVANVRNGMLCSQQFVDVLNDIKASFTAFPASLRGQELSSPYFFGVVHQYDHVIDREHSESSVDAASEYGGHFEEAATAEKKLPGMSLPCEMVDDAS